jgi:hypothetical protein
MANAVNQEAEVSIYPEKSGVSEPTRIGASSGTKRGIDAYHKIKKPYDLRKGGHHAGADDMKATMPPIVMSLSLAAKPWLVVPHSDNDSPLPVNERPTNTV